MSRKRKAATLALPEAAQVAVVPAALPGGIVEGPVRPTAVLVPKILSRWDSTLHAVVADQSGLFMLDRVVSMLANEQDRWGIHTYRVLGFTESETHYRVHYELVHQKPGRNLLALPPGRGE